MQFALILLSSLASAAGNYLFLGGLEDQKSYILALSVSSSIAGFLAYGILPQIVSSWPSRKVGLLFGIIASLCCGAIGILLGFSSSVVFLMIFAYINGEILLSQSGDWLKVHICRIAMFVTGWASWLLLDQQSIFLRGVLMLALLTCLIKTRRKAPEKEPHSENTKNLFVLLVLSNLFWVYVTPLIIVFDASDKQAFMVYLITTISPLVYFKVQDVIFKTDVIGPQSSKSNNSNFLLLVAIPLTLAYLAAVPLSAWGLLSSSPLRTLLFSSISILLLLSNYLITKMLSEKNKEAS